MTPGEYRARLRTILDKMNSGLGAVDASDESMVGAVVEIPDASSRMQTGLDYVMRVAAENKRGIAVMREANAAALDLLNDL